MNVTATHIWNIGERLYTKSEILASSHTNWIRILPSRLDEANLGIVIPKLPDSGMMKWDDYEYFLFSDGNEKAKIRPPYSCCHTHTHTHPPPTREVEMLAHSSVAALYLMQRLLSSDLLPPPHNVGCLSEKRKYSVVCGIIWILRIWQFQFLQKEHDGTSQWMLLLNCSLGFSQKRFYVNVTCPEFSNL